MIGCEQGRVQGETFVRAVRRAALVVVLPAARRRGTGWFRLHRMPYGKAVSGVTGLNYQVGVEGRASTPLLEVAAGDLVRVNLLAPWSEQVQVPGAEGHRWAREPGLPGTDLVSAVALGGLEARTMWLDAGGPAAHTGDYRYGNARGAYREAGQWGVLRVHPACDPPETLRPLDGSCGPGAGMVVALVAVVVAVAAAVVAMLVVAMVRSRRRHRADGVRLFRYDHSRNLPGNPRNH
ncbi:hypothetical protein [Pseudonocardia nigra]|uniref:hypothetical protein n=1 Tax=Pseudonocardia nigra TaxID=1921578 RepID=UPI001C5EAF41|nr:hypothetical protein [Pseudonocardia nigra]